MLVILPAHSPNARAARCAISKAMPQPSPTSHLRFDCRMPESMSASREWDSRRQSGNGASLARVETVCDTVRGAHGHTRPRDAYLLLAQLPFKSRKTVREQIALSKPPPVPPSSMSWGRGAFLISPGGCTAANCVWNRRGVHQPCGLPREVESEASSSSPG